MYLQLYYFKSIIEKKNSEFSREKNIFDDLVSRVSFQANEKGVCFEITLRGAETK